MKPSTEALQKGQLTAALMESGIVLMMRQNLRRRHASATEAVIDELLRAWLHRQADSVPGDVSGPVRIRSVSG